MDPGEIPLGQIPTSSVKEAESVAETMSFEMGIQRLIIIQFLCQDFPPIIRWWKSKFRRKASQATTLGSSKFTICLLILIFPTFGINNAMSGSPFAASFLV